MAEASTLDRRWRAARRFVRHQPLGTVALAVIVALFVIAVFAPWVSPSDPTAFHADAVKTGPSFAHPFGTDNLGQDMMSRIFHGARVSLSVAAGAVVMGTAFGALLGLLSGYWSNTFSSVIERFVDGMMAFPALVLALVVVSMFGAGLRETSFAIAAALAPSTARVVRSSVLSVRVEPYVDAGRAIGATSTRMILQHILPNVVPTIIVLATVQLGSAILAEASLSFLGLGAPPTEPSWGQMLSSDARRYMQSAPWLAIFPGLFLSLAVMSVNLFGDALRDVLDPRMRGAR